MFKAGFKKLNKDMKRKQLLNNKGFSLIELVVTIAIMVALITVASVSIVTLYKAKTKSAAEKVGAVISQCKINSLSGIANYMELSYDREEKEYVCNLYKIGGELYKTENVGNSFIDIVADGTSLKGGKKLYISFSGGSGSVAIFEVDEENPEITKDTKTDNLKPSYNIMFSSGDVYNIEVYTITGEHTVEKV